MTVTVDEAAKCPKCGVLGKLRSTRRRFFEGEWWDVGAYYCVNEDCNWFNTGWAVSSNEQGIVYERPQGERGQDKTFNKMSRAQLAHGRAQVEEVLGRDAEEEDDQELRNPNTPRPPS